VRIGVVSLYIKLTQSWRKLADVTALEWMRKWCGESAVKTVWGPLLFGKFATHAPTISMAWLWARLNIRTNSKQKGESKELLGYVRGGFHLIVEALEREILKHGGEVITGTRAMGLEKTPRGYACMVGEERVECERVVFTGSNQSYLRATQGLPLPAEYREQVAQVDYLGAVCLIFRTPQKLGDYYWTNVNEDGAPFLVFIRHTKLVEAERYGGDEVYYIGAYCDLEQGLFLQPKEEIRAEWFRYLQQLYPEFQPELVEEESVFKFRDAQHVVRCGYEESIVEYASPLEGLYLANFTQIYPEDRGTNFAVAEGEKVAERVLSGEFKESGH